MGRARGRHARFFLFLFFFGKFLAAAGRFQFFFLAFFLAAAGRYSVSFFFLNIFLAAAGRCSVSFFFLGIFLAAAGRFSVSFFFPRFFFGREFFAGFFFFLGFFFSAASFFPGFFFYIALFTINIYVIQYILYLYIYFYSFIYFQACGGIFLRKNAVAKRTPWSREDGAFFEIRPPAIPILTRGGLRAWMRQQTLTPPPSVFCARQLSLLLCVWRRPLSHRGVPGASFGDDALAGWPSCRNPSFASCYCLLGHAGLQGSAGWPFKFCIFSTFQTFQAFYFLIQEKFKASNYFFLVITFYSSKTL